MKLSATYNDVQLSLEQAWQKVCLELAVDVESAGGPVPASAVTGAFARVKGLRLHGGGIGDLIASCEGEGWFKRRLELVDLEWVDGQFRPAGYVSKPVRKITGVVAAKRATTFNEGGTLRAEPGEDKARLVAMVPAELVSALHKARGKRMWSMSYITQKALEEWFEREEPGLLQEEKKASTG